MCWFTSEKRRAEPRIAKRNIPVIKLYYKSKEPKEPNELYSIYYSACYIYKVNKKIYAYDKHGRHIVPSPRRFANAWKIDAGLHSIKNEQALDNLLPYYMAYRDSDSVLIKCYIPKGATYFLNENGEYVSSELIFGPKITKT